MNGGGQILTVHLVKKSPIPHQLPRVKTLEALQLRSPRLGALATSIVEAREGAFPVEE